MNTRSVRFQLLAWYTSLLVVAFGAVWLLMFVAVRQFALQNLRELHTRRARQIVHLAQRNASLSETALAEQIRRWYEPETPELQSRFVRVTQGTNVLFVSGPPLNRAFSPLEIPIRTAARSGFWVERLAPQEMLIACGAAIRPEGNVLVEVGSSTAPVNTEVIKTLAPLIIAAPIFLILAAAGAYALIGRALRPVVRITRSAEEITLQNTNAALPAVRTGDEIETLVQSLNRMIQRIRDTVENNKRFVADASHELRTPLAVLRGELESVLNRDNLSDAARETLASNLEEVERLGKIVHGLVALSRLDAGEAQSEAVVFDLGQLAANTADQMSLLAEDKGVALERQTSAAPIRGDPARIKQVIVNLLDNAIKYTPAGGAVQISARQRDGRALLEIADQGIGIPSDSLSRIFERFYTVDKARSREIGGSGLGLAIVKAICDAHSARIDVASAPGQGARFEVSFPAAAAERGPSRTAKMNVS